MGGRSALQQRHLRERGEEDGTRKIYPRQPPPFRPNPANKRHPAKKEEDEEERSVSKGEEDEEDLAPSRLPHSLTTFKSVASDQFQNGPLSMRPRPIARPFGATSPKEIIWLLRVLEHPKGPTFSCRKNLGDSVGIEVRLCAFLLPDLI